MNYELMVVTTAVSSTDPILAKIEKSIKEAEASNLKVEKLGKKVLAYPIAKQQEGEYALFNFEAPPEAIDVISKMLRLEREAILRYLIIKAPKAPKITKVTKEPEEPKETKAKVIVTTKTAVKTATKVSKVQKTSKAKNKSSKK